ncbi:MAG: iron ABC transporter [Flavobacteriaceae bacterium]|nr:iron ABC transporter [Flavobacteriaceae bacterium]
MKTQRFGIPFLILSLGLVLFFLLNIRLGSVDIPLNAILKSIINDPSVQDSWRIIVMDFRIPKAITACIAGAGLAISGLFMQTLFRNPLAGPFILGISSGASLGVALLILGAGIFGGFLSAMAMEWALPIAASLGAFLVLLSVLLASNKIKNTMSILIIGLMFSSFAAAIISVLSYFSEADKLQQFIFWGFGSLANLSWNQVLILSLVFFVALMYSIRLIKPLNSLLLGENYAKSLGMNTQGNRTQILVITSLFTGVITAFVGPIAFIGLAVPHIARLVFNSSNHKVLLPSSAILGAIILLICDIVAQLPNNEITLPINAITSIFGAPVVIWLLIKKKKIFI